MTERPDGLQQRATILEQRGIDRHHELWKGGRLEAYGVRLEVQGHDDRYNGRSWARRCLIHCRLVLGSRVYVPEMWYIKTGTLRLNIWFRHNSTAHSITHSLSHIFFTIKSSPPRPQCHFRHPLWTNSLFRTSLTTNMLGLAPDSKVQTTHPSNLNPYTSLLSFENTGSGPCLS